MYMCVRRGGARGLQRGAPSHLNLVGPCFPAWVTDPDQTPTSAMLFQAGPQTTACGSSVCEEPRKLENFPPNVSLLHHALVYISTSPPQAIKTHAQSCPPKTGLKIHIAFKQTRRSESRNPDLSQNDEAGLFQSPPDGRLERNKQAGREGRI